MAERTEGSTSTSQATSETTKCEEISDHSKFPDLAGQPVTSIGDMQIFPTVYPALIPNFATIGNQEHSNGGAGLYAVPVLPFAGSVTGAVPDTLIPLTYSVPTAHSSEGGATGQENEPAGQQGAQAQQQRGPDGRVIVRHFQIAINLDLPLLLKLVAVIYLFHQDGSRQRLALLVFLASIVYLYQTGALEPLTRWLSRSLNRVPQPARPPRDALPPDDVILGNENAALAERRQEGERIGEAENENQADGDGNPPDVNNQPAAEEEAGRRNVNPLWGLMKEIQIIVLGFLTSLLPGFQHLD
uniref:Uncharacterized protein n=1 Tax=Kalanchoe fedtschenkoi TaxID=63787 RepID=A0A7N0SV99_KALFE